MAILEKENQLVISQLHLIQEELERLYVENSQLKEEVNKNSFLLTQLHQAQEDIEQYYLEKESIRYEFEQFAKKSKAFAIQLENENNLLLDHLHTLQEKIEIQEKEQLKQIVHYSTEDLIKKDLPYRVGSRVIKNSKSISGLAKLPIDLAKEYSEYKQNDLPSIDKRDDIEKVEKVKEHLSYKLGKEIVESIESPKNMISLPTRIGREIISFNKNKKNKK